jgi:low affinity Fe/Cu permease
MRWLEITSQKATEWAGSSWAFLAANLTLLVWLITGPFVGFVGYLAARHQHPDDAGHL